jgi:hypothetical protein
VGGQAAVAAADVERRLDGAQPLDEAGDMGRRLASVVADGLPQLVVEPAGHAYPALRAISINVWPAFAASRREPSAPSTRHNARWAAGGSRRHE